MSNSNNSVFQYFNGDFNQMVQNRNTAHGRRKLKVENRRWNRRQKARIIINELMMTDDVQDMDPDSWDLMVESIFFNDVARSIWEAVKEHGEQVPESVERWAREMHQHSVYYRW